MSTAESWKWCSAVDEAIGGRPPISPPALVASCGPDLAVATSSSVRPEPRRVPKRPKDLEDLIREMEVERERKAAEREERRWREMEKKDRRERERQAREERRARESEDRWCRETSDKEEKSEGDKRKG
ncbi:hypothetical protein PO909_029468 [Leuciscus waleckii]